MSVIEALAAGVPVVASNVGGIPEILSDSEVGILVEPNDPSALEGALSQLISNKALYEQMVEAAPKHAKRFSLSAMISKLRSFYLGMS